MTKEIFSSDDKLKLHQLRIAEWYSENNKNTQKEQKKTEEIPSKWNLTKGKTLYDWQKDCVNTWFKNEHKGTVKVVTGAGKTFLALAIAERLQNDTDENLNIAIVVPTIVLMHQWYDELIESSNIPSFLIGRSGGGYKETFNEGKRINISVLVTASRSLKKNVDDNKAGKNLLLIIDECHRAGSAERKTVLEVEHKYALGLSATPERDENSEKEDEKDSYDNSDTGKVLGKIIYELNYKDALKYKIIPPFSISHFGIPLNKKESAEYKRLSRSINDNKRELRSQKPSWASNESDFWKWIRSLSNKDGNLSGVAARLQMDVSKRKDLLYGMEERTNLVKYLLDKEFKIKEDTQVLLFHESIKGAMSLYQELYDNGYKVIVEHSQLPASVRESGLNLFRKGTAKILVSVKSLIEGFNVPAVDVGIIVASSTSVRQRIQSLGRVMRKHSSKNGEENSSAIKVLYAKDTVDEIIYEKLDWNSILGAENNLYYHWNKEKGPLKQNNPPRNPPLTEKNIDVKKLGLKSGDIYPGVYEGDEYTCDNSKSIFDLDKKLVNAPFDLADKVLNIKGPGRFRVTLKKNYVLVTVPDPVIADKWNHIYIDTLSESLKNKENNFENKVSDINEWIKTAKSGDS